MRRFVPGVITQNIDWCKQGRMIGMPIPVFESARSSAVIRHSTDSFSAMKAATMMTDSPTLPILSFLQQQLAGTLDNAVAIHMKYPTAISLLLGMRLVAIAEHTATIELDADAEIHGNQQGTVHGGLIAELADATIGTAHSTGLAKGESFASIDLKINFLRPVWKSRLVAVAKAIHKGQNISHYQCDIFKEDGKLLATAVSAVMTLRGVGASGR
jgi:uncharacterized protein (TIGR00369 family)